MIELTVPLLLLLVSGAALQKKADVYALLTDGAQDGLRLLLTVAPALIIWMTAVTMLQRSGFFELTAPYLGPVCRFFGIPEELAPLMLVRPVSGSAALGIGADEKNAPPEVEGLDDDFEANI